MIKTKIIATLGPSCTEAETIRTMIGNGVDVFRLNFSHGTLEEHAELSKVLNAARSQHHHTTAVMGDLCGPKIRTSKAACPFATPDVTTRISETRNRIFFIRSKYNHS